MTRINLLPWREMRRKEQDRQMLSIGVGVWLLMALVVFYAHLHMTSQIALQNRRNAFLSEQIAKVDAEIKQIGSLKKQRQALLARMNVIQKLQGARNQVVHMFDSLVRCVPPGTYLTGLAQTKNVLTLRGVAQSNARVSTFMRNLDGSDWFTNSELEVINVVPHGNDRVSNFVLRVEQADGPKPTLEAKNGAKP